MLKRIPKLAKIIFGVLLFIIIIFVGFNFYVYHGFGYQPDIYRKGDGSKPWVTITFDDGPSPIWTPKILDILAEYQVPATFFLVGSHVIKYPDVAERIVKEGHEVGSHTFDHVNIPTTSTIELSAQLFLTTVAIFEATGEFPKYLRPPRGMYDARVRRLAEILDQPIVLWSISGQDWRPGVTVQQIVKRVVNQTKPGDILLFHDSGALITNEGASREATVSALPLIIEGIRDKGLEIVSLEEMMKYAKPTELTGQEMLDLRE